VPVAFFAASTQFLTDLYIYKTFINTDLRGFIVYSLNEAVLYALVILVSNLLRKVIRQNRLISEARKDEISTKAILGNNWITIFRLNGENTDYLLKQMGIKFPLHGNYLDKRGLST